MEKVEKSPAEWGVTIGEELIGTALSLTTILESKGLPDTYDLDADFCEALDNVTLNCVTCGWWHPSDEIDDWGNCRDCNYAAGEEE